MTDFKYRSCEIYWYLIYFIKFVYFLIFSIYVILEKLVNKKYFLVKKILIFKFWFYFEWKKNSKEIKNVLLFIDYIKFSLQSLIAIYFVLNFFFQFLPLNFDFCINFSLHYFYFYFFYYHYFFLFFFLIIFLKKFIYQFWSLYFCCYLFYLK